MKKCYLKGEKLSEGSFKGPDEERNMEWSIFQTAAGPGELNFQD